MGRGFEDALDAAGRIGRGFSSFWNGQCQATRDSLVAMDITGTGRVKLSDFYGANQGGEWRFGESEAYLRELGALDETGSSKQVLIANYMQGASNCAVMRDHYLVCCMNECESGDLVRSCNLNPTMKTIVEIGGEKEKGKKTIVLEDMYPLFKKAKDSKDTGGIHDFVEILKLYDKNSDKTMLSKDLFRL